MILWKQGQSSEKYILDNWTTLDPSIVFGTENPNGIVSLWYRLPRKRILIGFFGRNPNRPYDVYQLFGGGLGKSPARRVDKVKHWEPYQIESQKYLRIGTFAKLFRQTV